MARPTSELRLGLIGHGTVGQAFASAIASHASRLETRLQAVPRVVRIAVRRPDRVTAADGRSRVDDDADGLVADPGIDIVVEASGARRAATWLLAALARGVPAVSANKLAIASSPPLLQAIADRHPLLWCEGSVGAAIPIVRALRDSLDGETVHGVRGVLNGTTTFILSEVERGATFEDALARAVAQGLAEGDGAADLEGHDAAAKLAILATLAWRTPIPAWRVRRRGIDPRIVPLVRQAAAAGACVRLVAEAWQGATTHLVVEPRELPADDPLGTAVGVTNAVEVRAELAGQLRWFGPGAGGARTASGLVGDLILASDALRGGATRRAAA